MFVPFVLLSALPALVSSRPETVYPNRLQSPLKILDSNSSCNCSGTNSSGPPTIPPSICNDARLGPVELPRTLPLLSFVSDYDRFGGAQPGKFLEKWTDSSTGNWTWPEKDGYSLDLDGKPIKGNMVLEVGTIVDRFGEETGRYVSAADAPYDQRSLPPSSLNTAKGGDQFPYGYHVYTVAKPLTVLGGPIAPWFGQPGLGAQFYIGGTNRTNILQLIELGYLARLHKRDVRPGAGEGGGCGL